MINAQIVCQSEHGPALLDGISTYGYSPYKRSPAGTMLYTFRIGDEEPGEFYSLVNPSILGKIVTLMDTKGLTLIDISDAACRNKKSLVNRLALEIQNPNVVNLPTGDLS